MKSILIMLVSFGFISEVSAQEVQITISPVAVPVANGWQQSAGNSLLDALYTNSTTWGDPNYPDGISIEQSNMIMGNKFVESTFNSWRGQAAPTGNFAGQTGGGVTFAMKILPTDGGQIELDNLSETITSSNPAILPNQSLSYANNDFGDGAYGVVKGPDGVLGTSDDVIVVTNSYNGYVHTGQEPVDEIVVVGSLVGVLAPNATGTLAQQASLDATETLVHGISITATGSYNGISLDSQTFGVVPEPTTVLMALVGGLMLAFRRRR